MKTIINSEAAMRAFGEQLGAGLRGGEVIELVGDIGAGKTTLTKGIARGMGLDEDIQSPSFTISRVYERPSDGVRLAHYDFYRLTDAGIMADELSEATHDPRTVTVIEWAGIVAGVLPADHMTITLQALSEQQRQVEVVAHGVSSQRVAEVLA